MYVCLIKERLWINTVPSDVLLRNDALLHPQLLTCSSSVGCGQDWRFPGETQAR